MTSRTVTDAERRHRIGRRHALAPEHRVDSPEEATTAMTVLHATEAPTVYLSVAARAPEVTVEDIDRALYDDRSLVKQLAMRRTLFVLPRDLLPAAWGSASARVADTERRKIARNVEDDGRAPDGLAWLETVGAAVEDVLDGVTLSAQQVREAVPELDGKIAVSATSPWGGPVPIAPRVLTMLGAAGLIVRGRNAGHWRVNRPAWTLMSDWLGEVPAPLDVAAGYAELVRRWLRTFGPGTEADLVWWLGSTKTAVRRALADVGAVEVALVDSDTGWLLPDDLEPEPEVAPWAALLPTLDPTTMGWRDRQFYLDPAHTPFLFDTNGNGGTTIWWDGRIVGCWVQDPDGVVVPVLREDLGSDGEAAVATEVERLTTWLDGEVISSVYASAQMKQARLP